MKPGAVIFCLFALSFNVHAQTLFTYGGHPVDKSEFLKAYTKNNSDSNGTPMSYKDYLELYARFKMKVQWALDEKLDTTQQQRSETEAFRNQLAESYLKEDASIKLLVEEAAERSRKDIHLASIYVPFKPEPTADELKEAEEKINEAYNKLKKGEPFDKVAAEYSYADFGFITTFVLPYEIENIAYTTPVGKYSAPHKGTKAFHIFRPLEERNAIGTIRVAQILIAFPPHADEIAKRNTAERADSVYRVLQSGADFAALAERVSDDNLSYQTRGELPVFGIGKYEPAFEKAAFALLHDSDISKPVPSAFGYHIIKRLERIPVTKNIHDKEWNAILKDRVEQSDRMRVAQQALLKNIRSKIKPEVSSETLASDTAVLNYYRNHLEKYNPEFAEQLQEFKDGNLLFTIMQKNVWDAASADSIALQKYYDAHKDKYWWENSADAIIVTCHNPKEAETARTAMQNDFRKWQKLMENSNGLIQADSGRFELAQIPVAERTNFTEGLLTAPVNNPQDNSISFAYIIKRYRDHEAKNFEDAKGLVINDYQNYLEEMLEKKLKEKYPVRINNKVFKKLK